MSCVLLFFFLFKQKTAYELRISDWSSDVCSSDLVAAYAWNGSVKALRDQGVPVAYMTPKEGILTWVCGLTLSSSPIGDEQQAYDFIDAMISPEEIGRASCRVRVCQYV